MKGEIDRDWYCTYHKYPHKKCDYASFHDGIQCTGGGCPHAHRKHPTPENFREEYGEEWEGAVYILCTFEPCDENCNSNWHLYENEKEALADLCGVATEETDPILVCACTPWAKPPDDWRPA